MRRAASITRQVNLIIIASLGIGVGAAIASLAVLQNARLIRSIDEGVRQQAAIIYQAVKNAMLSGQAPIARFTILDIQRASQDLARTFRLHLVRADGVEAFSDNATIRTVNANLAREAFAERPEGAAKPMIPEGNQSFGLAVRQRRPVTLREVIEGKAFRAYYQPLINLPKCTGCHGSEHTVRGVIYMAADLSDVPRAVWQGVAAAGGSFLAVVALLSVLLASFMRRRVIDPVKRIGAACARVTGGDFEARVRVDGGDELAELAGTVNRMVEGLYERFHLAKYVSRDTLRAIREGEGAARATVTVLFSDIRGFTAYSERESPDRVVLYLNRLLSAQTEIIHRHGGDVDKYVGDQVMARFAGPAAPREACEAAVEIRREVEGAGPERYGGLRVGVGINTGEVILGMIGSEQRADRTVIGDPVNLAARLCGAAKAGQIVVAAGTARALEGRAALAGPYRLAVKGKSGWQRVYLLEEREEVRP